MKDKIKQDLKSPDHLKNTNNKPRLRLKKLAVVGLFFLLLLVIGGFMHRQYILKIKSTNPSKTISTSQLVTPTPPSIDATFVFYREDELWAKDKSGSSRKITKTDGSIYAFDYSYSREKVAYITGTKKTNENNYTNIEPESVHLYSLDTSSDATIYRLTPKILAGNGYSEQIIAIKFSPDGSILAITTTDSMYFYDVQGGSLQKVFSKPTDLSAGIGSRVYGYHDPLFSPSNSYVVLEAGYYEGSGQDVVNISTGEVTDLPYSSYSSGEVVLGWVSETHFIIAEFESEKPISLYKVAFPSLEKKLITNVNYSFSQGFLYNDHAYIVAYSLNAENKNNNVVIKVNLTDGDINELYQTKNTTIYDLSMLPEIKRLLISTMEHPNQKKQILSVDKGLQIEQNASLSLQK